MRFFQKIEMGKTTVCLNCQNDMLIKRDPNHYYSVVLLFEIVSPFTIRSGHCWGLTLFQEGIKTSNFDCA